MSTDKEVPLADAQRFPDHRHLRRVAEAIAGRDDDRDVWAVVQISNDIPFNCEVFDAEQDALAFAAASSARTPSRPWVVVPSHSEPSESAGNGFFVVMHGPTSPTATRAFPEIDRNSVKRYRLLVDYVDGTGSTQTKEVDLTSPSAQSQALADKWPANPLIDAIFFTMEALDKYMFPNLVMTYGVRGANTLRRRAIRQLEKEGLDIRSDVEDVSDAPFNEGVLST